MRELPKAGEIWLHFKGNYYEIVALATHTETSEKLVIYGDIGGGLVARPLDMFMGVVQVDKNARGITYRFEKVGDSID